MLLITWTKELKLAPIWFFMEKSNHRVSKSPKSSKKRILFTRFYPEKYQKQSAVVSFS